MNQKGRIDLRCAYSGFQRIKPEEVLLGQGCFAHVAVLLRAIERTKYKNV